MSVVVPVRNRRDLIDRCLDALTAQTFASFEVIVVDDGSTDGSGEVVRGWARRDGRVQLVASAAEGAVAGRARGLERARGRIVAFTDSDCAPEPGWLAAGVAAVDAGADVVQGRTVAQRRANPHERTTEIGREDGLYQTCNVFYRRAALEAVSGFDLSAAARFGFRHGTNLRGLGFGEDTLLGWRVRRAGGAAFEPAAVVRHHVFPPDAADSLRRAWATGGFPSLIAEVPELGPILLRNGYALGTWSRTPLVAGVGAALLRRRTLAAAGFAVWVAARWRRLERRAPTRGAALRALPLDLAVDAVTAAALAVGSTRARRLVL